MIAVLKFGRHYAFAFVAVGLLGMLGCAPEVGSSRWCEVMREKPRGDWTANEALEYARSCILEQRRDE